MDVTTGSGGTLTNFSVVGSAGSLHVVDGHSLSPLGIGVPAVAGTTTLQVSGTGLTALDVVILVPQVSSGTATCLNVGGEVFTENPVLSGSTVLSVQFASNVATGAVFLVCIQYAGQGVFYGLSSTAANMFSVTAATSVSPAQFSFTTSELLYVSGSGLSTRDVYYAVASTATCASGATLAPTVTAMSPVPVQVSFNTNFGVTIGISGGVGLSFRLCLQPGGEPSSSNVVSVAVGVVISAFAVSTFSPVAVPTVSGISMTISGSGFPISSGVVVSVVSAGSLCSGVSLPVTPVAGVTSGIATFTSDASSLAVGSSWSVCLAAAGGTPAFVAVGGSTALLVVNGQGILPVGVPLSMATSGSSFTIVGSGMAASDVVTLVRIDVAGSTSCSNSASGGQISTTDGAIDPSTSNLVVQLSAGVSSGAQYNVCVRYRGQGAFYRLSNLDGSAMLSVVSLSSVSVTQYNLQSVYPLSITGSGLSANDVYFAVIAGASSCTASQVGAVLLNGVAVSVFNSQVSLNVQISGGVGQSFSICVQPGGNPVLSNAVLLPSTIVSAVSVSSFSPTAIPAIDGVAMTITGNAFPYIGGNVIVQV